jgi:hypothetical protein
LGGKGGRVMEWDKTRVRWEKSETIRERVREGRERGEREWGRL